MLKDLLFELGSEELPSGAVWPLADALANQMVALLARAGLQHGEVHRFATPRRLAVLIHDVQTIQAPQTISRRGPTYAMGVDATGKPQQALLGFAKSCGVTVDELQVSKTDKGEWWCYETVTPGAAIDALLPKLIKEALAALPIAKPMRWGAGEEQFARPVHWAVLLLGTDVVAADILGVTTSRMSYGHRFHHPHAVDITTPRAYAALLKDAFVIADFAERRQIILDQVQHLAALKGDDALMPETLVDEVTSIVEWPQALLAHFEEDFLEVPAEALIAAMQSHQKCFALRDAKQQLRPYFITVSNIVSQQPARVVKGNEDVMRARLSDAAFFYTQDRQHPLSHYYAATAQVIFQARLGSLQDKMQRLSTLMTYLHTPLLLSLTDAKRAAELSKCDLMTGMVNEFPELQGLMGYYYALNDGEAPQVAQALNEQYMPRFAGDSLPQSALGLALSLADRLDNLVGSFALGQKPTGVKDPFKLRRHALAVVRLLMSTDASLPISTLIAHALDAYGATLPEVEGAITELKPFILERLQSFYQAEGVSQDIVQAVRACQDELFDDIDKRIKALVVFKTLAEAASLAAACKRVGHLLQRASIASDKHTVDEALFEATAEKVLFTHIKTMEQTIAPLYDKRDYIGVLSQLATLREPVDTFFEQVMVMVEDPRIKTNRLSLLANLQRLLLGVADISLLS